MAVVYRATALLHFNPAFCLLQPLFVLPCVSGKILRSRFHSVSAPGTRSLPARAAAAERTTAKGARNVSRSRCDLAHYEGSLRSTGALAPSQTLTGWVRFIIGFPRKQSMLQYISYRVATATFPSSRSTNYSDVIGHIQFLRLPFFVCFTYCLSFSPV